MATAGSIVVDLLMKTGSFETDAQRAAKVSERQFKEIERHAKATASSITKSFSGLLGGALFGIGVRDVFAKFVQETRNAQDEQAQLAAALTATGQAAGYTAAQLNDMATKFAGASIFSEGDINRAQTRLLSYTGIVGEQFPRALQATIDTAQRMGMTVEQAAETVGRALDVPSAGLSSLSKQGFRFTEDQKKLAKRLESTGQAAKAQDIILSALESSYGGAAQAARGTLGGALQALQNQIDSLMTGDEGSVNGLTAAVNDLTDSLGNDDTKQAFATFLQGLATIATKAVELGADFVTLTERAGGFLEMLGAFSPANGIVSLFRNDSENLSAAKKELEDLAAMQERLNNGTAKWNDYGQESLDVAKRAAQTRLEYFERLVKRGQIAQDNALFGPYGGAGETGGSPLAPTIPTAPVLSGKGGKTKKSASETAYERYLKQLREGNALFGAQTELAKVNAQIQLGSFGKLTEAKANDLRQAAMRRDALEAEQELYKERGETLDEFIKQLEEEGKAYQAFYDKVTGQGAAKDFIGQMGMLAAMEGDLTPDQFAKAQKDLLQQFGDTMDTMDEFARSAAQNIQTQLGDGLYSVITGNFDDIGKSFANMLARMAADLAASEISKLLLGNYGKTGNIGGLAGGLWGMLTGGAAGAASSGITASSSFVAGGTAFAFEDGGFTGNGGRFDPAGIVHRGEGVLNQDEIRAIGGEQGFNALRRAIRTGHSAGGMAGSPSLPPSAIGQTGGESGLSLVFETHGVDVEVVEERERQYRFIARQEIDARVPGLMAREQARPNSRFSRQQSLSTNIQRQR